MFQNGQIVYDVIGKQLVMFAGLYQNKETGDIAIPYLTQEMNERPGDSISGDEVLWNLNTTHVEFPDTEQVFITTDFEEMKAAIRERKGMADGQLILL